MTELSWLCETLLDDKLGISDKLKRRIIKRIAFVEAGLSQNGRSMPAASGRPMTVPKGMQGQAPSTIAAMLRHGTQTTMQAAQDIIPMALPEPISPGIVVASPQAAQAIAQRQSALAAAMSDKMVPEPGRTGPRKF